MRKIIVYGICAIVVYNVAAKVIKKVEKVVTTIDKMAKCWTASRTDDAKKKGTITTYFVD